MNTHYRKADNYQRGFSLVEVLIAVVIFAVIFIAALMMYDRSTGVFKRGVEAADAQQNTRVAFDRVVADLRMAGFDYDRDGFPAGSVGSTWADGRAYGLGVIVIPTTANGFTYRATTAGTSGGVEPAWPITAGDTINDNGIIWETMEGSSQSQQPDEQIEYAGPTAITIRANLDYESDAASENGREGILRDGGGKVSYESGQFPVVTTGNDEIVTYALRSHDASKNVDSVTFFADVNAAGTPPSRTAYPGGSSERLVTFSNVDLSNENPPYTLIRFTLDDQGNPVESPLAENIRSLNFLYFQDIQGVTPLRDLAEADVPDAATILGAGQYNPATPGLLIAERSVRSRIKSIRMQLVGMNDQPDNAYTDAIETVASAVPFRKYRLETLIVPRNIGKRGLREQDTTPPGTPVLTKVWFGHCGIAKVEWTAPPDGGAVEQYTILFDNDGDPTDGYRWSTQVGGALFGYAPVYVQAPTTWHTDTWSFAVQAVSSFGNGLVSNEESGSVLNRTKPMAITGLTTSTDTNGVVLTWQRPVDNVSGLDDIVATPGGTVAREGIAAPREPLFYEVYRDTDIDFDPAESNRIHDGFAAGAAKAVEATGLVTFTDTTAINCKTYYYRVRVTDLCGAESSGKNVSLREGLSAYYPPESEPAIEGENEGSGLAPAAPTNLIIENTSVCAGASCTVNLSWAAVTTDTAAARTAVEHYYIRWQPKLGTAIAGVPGEEEIFVDPSAATVTATVTVPNPEASGGAYDKHAFTVYAEQCDLESAPSPERTFPCDFIGGSADVNVSGAIDGAGDSPNPYLIFGSSNLTVSGLSVASVTATLYRDATVIAGPGSYTVSGGAAIIPLGDPDDDESLYRAELSIQDTGGCVITRTVYFMGTATNCCLVLERVTGVTVGSDVVTVVFRNQCSSNLTMTSTDSIVFNWDNAPFPGGASLDTITLPRSGGGTTTFSPLGGEKNEGRRTYSFSGAAHPVDYNIPADGTYSMLFDFSRNLTAASTPILDMCVKYGGTTTCNIIDDGLSGTGTCP